jgi:hypothetical protein
MKFGRFGMADQQAVTFDNYSPTKPGTKMTLSTSLRLPSWSVVSP